MVQFKTRKRDGQAFPLKGKVARDSGNPSYVGKIKVEKEEYDLRYLREAIDEGDRNMLDGAVGDAVTYLKEIKHQQAKYLSRRLNSALEDGNDEGIADVGEEAYKILKKTHYQIKD